MFYNAQNKQLKIEDTSIDYVEFGKGEKPLILIAGLGDGLRTMKGLAIPFTFLYKKFAKDYRVYVFSRRNKMREAFTTRDMAQDILYAMDTLHIKKADFIGVSQGGMLAQWCAIDAPEKVNKLVLVVTYAKSNEMTVDLIHRWKNMALHNQFSELMKDNVRFMYSDAYIRRNLWITPLIASFTKPKNFDRFLVMADACITHDASSQVEKIKAETLILGGEKDKTVGIEGSYELHKKIENSKLYVYPQWGHALYEEAKDFNDRILAFLKGN